MRGDEMSEWMMVGAEESGEREQRARTLFK
jgi:hypothetical protein